MDKINGVLEMFFYQFCSMAKWVFAIRMASDSIKRGNDSDIEGIIKSVINGGVGYGSLYAIVSILNAVQNSFDK
jgi:hypothetical protein